MRETKSHEARTKANLVTGMAEAGRQRVIPDPSGLGTSTRTRRPNRKENPCSGSYSRVEITPPAMGILSVPSLACYGEGSTPDQNLGMRSVGRSGVVGWACGKGPLEEGGRSCAVPGEESNPGRREAIRENPETQPGAVQEVGEARSSEEAE